MWRNPQGKEGAPGGLLTPCLIPPLSHPTFNQVALLLPVFCVRIRNETSLQKRVLPLFLKRVKENGSIRLIRWRFAEVSGVPEGTRLEPAWSPHADHRSPPRFYWLQDGDAERRTVNTPGDAQRGPEAQTPQGRHPGPWGPPSVSPRAGWAPPRWRRGPSDPHSWAWSLTGEPAREQRRTDFASVGGFHGKGTVRARGAELSAAQAAPTSRGARPPLRPVCHFKLIKPSILHPPWPGQLLLGRSPCLQPQDTARAGPPGWVTLPRGGARRTQFRRPHTLQSPFAVHVGGRRRMRRTERQEDGPETNLSVTLGRPAGPPFPGCKTGRRCPVPQ